MTTPNDQVIIWFRNALSEQEFVVFGRQTCPYTMSAVEWLKDHDKYFSFFDVSKLPKRHADYVKRVSKMTTVPQIYRNGKLIGGYDELENF